MAVTGAVGGSDWESGCGVGLQCVAVGSCDLGSEREGSDWESGCGRGRQ